MRTTKKKNAPKKSTAKSPYANAYRASLSTPVKATPVKAEKSPSVGVARSFCWKPWHSWVLLAVLLLAALLPFSNRAFHIDDTLFVFAGKNIVRQPLDPYGFVVNWEDYERPMSQVTKNPPLACYYIAAVGSLVGWSERALHLAFLLPALAVVLLTYRLAQRFAQSPLLAALLTLAAPAFLVSAASVMCDTMMLAIWILSVVLWLEGLDTGQPLFLASSAVLMGAATLTKYFGVALIPLLLAYSLYRERRLGRWLLYFLIPAGVIIGYQLWTGSLYTVGLFSDAASFASSVSEKASFATKTVEGLSFLGGCVVGALVFAPWVWSRRQMLIGLLGSCIAAVLVVTGFVVTGRQFHGPSAGVEAFHAHRVLFSLELTLFIAGGMSVLALAASDFRRHKDADSLLLLLWVVGTFVFTCYLNWTINARSVLPLVPAVAILIARRVASGLPTVSIPVFFRQATPLLVSAIIAVWILAGDSQLANRGRAAAYRAHELTGAQQSTVWFVGHWGLQYYMEELGARPIDVSKIRMELGDYLLIPENQSRLDVNFSPFLPRQQFEFPGPSGAITINRAVGAGFYSSIWGPLPFFLGPVPPERYTLVHLLKAQSDGTSAF